MSTGVVTPAAQGSFDLMKMDRQIQAKVLSTRVAKLAAWTALVAAGVSRRGVLGWFAAGVGIYGLVMGAKDWRAAEPEWKKLSADRQRGDAVNHASKESFPASDPPAAGQG